MDSILTSIKKLLGISEEYTEFDADILIHINSVFVALHQMGIGPSGGFSIADSSATWADYISGEVLLNDVKSYMYYKVRLMFDPPQSSAAMDNMKQLAAELEWRMNVTAEEEIE